LLEKEHLHLFPHSDENPKKVLHDPSYEENPITMGPEWVQINDTTWDMSKTKYSINVKDDKWDKQLIFHLEDKKIVSLGASMIMED